MVTMRLQDAPVVARRALCLGALIRRGQSEVMLQNLDRMHLSAMTRQKLHAEQQSVSTQLLAWLDIEHLSDSLSSNERDLLDTAPGGWDQKALVDTGWRVEALGTLLWALRMIERMPCYDTQFWPDAVMEPLDLFTPTIDMIWCAGLRPARQLGTARDLAELWHWRSHTTQIRSRGVAPPAGWTFPEIIKAAANKAHQDGAPAPIDDDFPAFGKAYADLTEEEYQRISSIAQERHFALNWLCGYSVDWDHTTIEL